MIITPEALQIRLAAAGISKVAVIDDAFDDRNLIALVDGVDQFLANAEASDDWLEQLASNEISCSSRDAFESDGLIALWRKRTLFQGSLGEAIKALFLNAEAKLRFPAQVAENLKQLGLVVECFDMPTAPKSEGPLEKKLEGVQLVFLDYDLEGEDNLELASSTRRSYVIAKALARRREDTPFLVLFSSLPGVSEEAETFRQEAFYLRGSFLFLRKVDAADFDTLCQRLEPSCVWCRDIGHFQHFFVTLRDRLREVSEDVERRFLQLDVQDYAHFQHVALQKDGAPLGEYMLELFGAVLSHEFRDGAKVTDARTSLDRIDLSKQHLPFHTQPTPPMERIYRSVLTEPGISVGPALPHPHAAGRTIEQGSAHHEMPPLLMLGDIFANSPEKPVYVVMNPACDLQYSMSERDPKWDLSVFLLFGTLESLAVPSSKPNLSERMRWLRYRNIDYRVLWDSRIVETVPLVDFNRWQTEKKYERIARLSLPFSLALQQKWLANLGRVGLPVSPPIHDAQDLEVFVPDLINSCWKAADSGLSEGAILATHPADSKEPVKFCLTVAARDYLLTVLEKLIPTLNGHRKVSAQKAMSDPTIWWNLVTRYHTFKQPESKTKDERWLWKHKSEGAAAENILCIWNGVPQQSDFDKLPHAAVVFVLRSGSSEGWKNAVKNIQDRESMVQRIAYEISMRRAEHGGTGDAMSDWLEAEEKMSRM